MKVGKSDRPSRSERVARPAKARGAVAPAAGRTTPVVTASVLGIPETEFTPRVRDAIMTLMHEVERLRGELDLTRARLDDMSRAADEDMLLPILNRRAFVREITRFIAFADRHGTPSSVLYFDLDDFKAVNDAYGHAAGDAVLRHFSDLLARQIRDTDVLARIGGDEFGIILAHVRLEQARKKGERLTQALRDNPPLWNGQHVKLTFSCGCYELGAGQSADLAMNEADRAMYAEKRNGLKPPKR